MKPALSRSRDWLIPAAAILACVAPAIAHAQSARSDAANYPARAVTFLVPFSPGGGSDIIARILAKKLTDAWNQSVVVENRTGGGGVIASDATAKAAPDGYTIMMATSSLAIQPSIRKLPFDTVRDFAPVTLACSSPYLLLVNPGVEARSVKELIDLAKAQPGKLNYGSAGAGSTLHLAAELFKSMAGVDIVHVPYKGAVAIPDLIAGHIQMAFFGLDTALPHIQSGKLRALGTTGPKRSAAAPEIPTIAEAGVPGYQVTAWYGLVAPARIDRAIVDKLQSEVARSLQSSEVKQKLAAMGIDPIGSTPEQFAKLIRGEIAQWGEVVKRAGIRAD